MRRLTFVTGLLGILVLTWYAEALHLRTGEWRPKRSLDINDVYQMSMLEQKLPNEVVPLSYELKIVPMISMNTFTGYVKINVTWNEKTDQIVFNAGPGLTIEDCNVKLLELSPREKELGLPLLDVNVAKVDGPRSKSRPWYTINLEQMVSPGSIAMVTICYSGYLSTNETVSYFTSEYMDSEWEKHEFMITHNLRLYNARNVFPCMDEPLYKANYIVKILRDRKMKAFSNMPLERSDLHQGMNGKILDTFVMSPKMATYQLAMMISDFESLEPSLEVNEIDGTRLQVTVWGRKDILESLKDVPDKVVRIINYVQDYFNSSIGVPKLDIVAVPNYNAPKPSDSWGLMFFKESDLSSPLIWNTAYEIIYQWIGQYITPAGWTESHTNKILNSFLAAMTTIDISPDEMEGKWPMTMLYSLYYEYGKAVPFSLAAGFRNEAISAKTELAFRMMNYTMGKDVFRDGVRKFVHQKDEQTKLTVFRKQRTFHAYDIYDRLTESACENQHEVSETARYCKYTRIIANAWKNRESIPVVTATRHYETKSISLTVKDYLREIERPAKQSWGSPWCIPLVMISEDHLDFSKTEPTAWLMNSNVNHTTKEGGRHWLIDDPSSKEAFLIINPEEIAMFLVNYDSSNWEMLSTFLQGPDRERIPVLTRAKLLHDSWNLAYANELNFAIALNMTLFLYQERNHVVWQPVFTMIDHIGRRIEGSEVYPKFEAYIQTLLKPLYEELGNTAQPGEPFWKVHMRGLAKNFLCREGYKPCIEEARSQYKKWLTDEEPDKGNPVANEFLCPVFKWGTEEEWEFGLQRVINFPRHSLERMQSERTYLLKTLASCPMEAYKIERLLNVTVLHENGNFTDSDIRLIFSMLSGSATGYKTLFIFLKNNWSTIRERFQEKSNLWNAIINSATSSFNTPEGLEMVLELSSEYYDEFGSAKNIILEALNIIRKRIEWCNRNLPDIDSWLNQNLRDYNDQTENITLIMTAG